MIKRVLTIFTICTVLFGFSSCATTKMNQSKEIDVNVSFTGSELDFGPEITGTIEISISEENDLELALGNAKSEARFRAINTAKGYDFLLFPKYSVEIKNGKYIVTVKGRAARPKLEN